jgi:hypothetical protein
LEQNEMSQNHKKVVLDAADGSDIADIVFVGAIPATVVVNVDAGVVDVEYSCDTEADIRADPDGPGITWIAWDFGQVAAGTPGINALVAPVTALRMLPVGGDATMNIVSDTP